jgi:hypothetical protein
MCLSFRDHEEKQEEEMKANRLLSGLTLGLSLALALGFLILFSELVSSSLSPLAPGSPVPHPEPNSHTAPPNTAVSITYDEPISPTTVSTQTFAVHAMQTGLLVETYGVHSGTIVLTPTQPFFPGELMQASATTGTLSLIDGQGPISPTVWSIRAAVLGGSGVFADSGQSLGSSSDRWVALGDLDGDRDLDALTAHVNGQPNKVWLNDGTGVFVDSGQSLGNSESHSVAVGDLDGDGDLDAFVGNGGAQPNKVWLNDGTAIFIDSGQDLGSSSSWSVALGDMDGDGDLDAFVGNGGGGLNEPNEVWLNDGAGTFVDSGQDLGNSDSRVALGDIDGDGDLDAFVANDLGQPDRVWLNHGTGTFVDSGQSLGSFWSHDVALGDIDGDGDLDALVGTWGNVANKLWLNEGAGTFVDSGQGLGDPSCRAAALGDLDGDGDLDAVIANDGNEANTVWLNDGAGGFADSGQRLGGSWSEGLALGDVDGDGDMDAFVGNGHDQADLVWLNQDRLADFRSYLPIILHDFPVVSYTEVAPAAGMDDPGGGAGMAWGDYNNDGYLDLFIVNRDDRPWPDVLFMNNGDGTFTDVTAGAGIGSDGHHGATWGDYDNDGDLDLYVVDIFSQNFLYRNNGDGTFDDVTSDAGVGNAGDGRLGAWIDYDNDGHLDLYVTNYGTNVLYKNNGDGTFRDVAEEAGVAYSGPCAGQAWGDFDNDGHADLFLTAHTEPSLLYHNNGDGTFIEVAADAGVAAPAPGWAAPVWGDYSNDGYLDLYVARDGANFLYRNNGDRTFSDVTAEAGVGNAELGEGTVFGDYDNDGHLDLYVSNEGQPNALYRNDGNGTFADVGALAGVDHAGAGQGTAFGDYDNDGDLDLYVMVMDDANLLYQNNGNNYHWLHVKTTGVLSNRDGIGARVSVTSGTLSQIREVSGGCGSFGSQDSLPVEFGLGTYAGPVTVEVRWPSGIMQTLTGVVTNQVIDVVEPAQREFP